ncbi:MAG: rhamnogalacturonan acetylesterase [Bacteroidales bacterium]|jgi:lysophospholipase L1-like esterase|nr:rhamnogalacturonan acetylesterase [Bacteroidales bacterium]
MKQLTTLLLSLSALTASAQSSSFTTIDIPLPKAPQFTDSIGFGYDLETSWDGKSAAPFFISANVPDGNYRVTVTIGSKKRAAETTIRCESRRLFIENLATKKGELVTKTFIVNKRDVNFVNEKGQADRVKLKKNEDGKLHWDNKLTFEINGDAPAIQSIRIERDTVSPTLYLCGNSTVVDQSNEPWASWGQMIPRFLDDSLSVANYAESGLAASSFLAQNRWAKIYSLLKKGDYVILEFGHNDQKADGHVGNGAYYAFSHQVKQILDQCRAKGATFIICTPTMRRSFEGNVVVNTHKDYPAAVRDIAKREGLLCIDLQDMTKAFYEAMGPEKSTQAFVHYPANTWPDQPKALADNTHFNPYGAYEIAKMVAQAIMQSNLDDLKKHISDDFKGFNPALPDPVESFKWNNSPFVNMTKPDGN